MRRRENRISVAVVGAGPAGCAAAISLRRRGVLVVLLDKARFPRDKVCGDVLLPSTVEALDALGLPIQELQAMAYECSGCRYFSVSGRSVSGDFRDVEGQARPCWTIPRLVFDNWLLKKTVGLGAEILQEHAVVGIEQTSSGATLEVRPVDGRYLEVDASFVVGADGASSIVARQLGVMRHDPEHTCLAVRGYAMGLKAAEPYLEVFTTRETLPGCAWILPVAPNYWNVGLGILKTTAQHNETTPSGLFREMVESFPALSERLAGATLQQLRGWPLPGATERRRLVNGRCLLAGDAGAMVDPFTGHGIHHALVAGRLAGEVIADALQQDDLGALDRYQDEVRKAMGREVSIGRCLQRIHASPFLMDGFTRLAAMHAGVRDTFLGLVGHANHRAEVLSAKNIGAKMFQWRRERTGA